VGEELYGVRVPVVVVDAATLATVRDGAPVEVDDDGAVRAP
jgi:hypothetical protein